VGGGGGGSPGNSDDSSDEGSDESSNGGSGSSQASYLFYSGLLGTGSSLPGILYAVDTSDPSTPIAIEADSAAIMGSIRTILSATYDATTQIVTDFHPYALIYAKTDGYFYQVNAHKNASLTPTQLSNESAANLLCLTADGQILLDGDTVVSDLANAENSQYVYSLPGIDNNCGTSDDQWKMIRLGMSASDEPIPAKPPLQVLTDFTTGAISGWLVNDLGTLKQCDANFSSCVSSSVSVASNVGVLMELDIINERYLLEIDDQLVVYDVETATASPPLFTVSASTSLGATATDGTTVYFVNENNIYQMPADGSAMAVVLLAESENIFRLDLTTNKVIYQTAQAIKQVDKAGGMSIELAAATDDDNIPFFVSGDFIYYSINNIAPLVAGAAISSSIIKAGIITENGSIQSEFMDANWVGLASPATFNLNNPISLFDDPAVLILVEGSALAIRALLSRHTML